MIWCFLKFLNCFSVYWDAPGANPDAAINGCNTCDFPPEGRYISGSFEEDAGDGTHSHNKFISKIETLPECRNTVPNTELLIFAK